MVKYKGVGLCLNKTNGSRIWLVKFLEGAAVIKEREDVLDNYDVNAKQYRVR